MKVKNKPLIQYDARNMFAPHVNGGLRSANGSWKRRLQQAKERVLKDWMDGKQGWLGSPDDIRTARRVQELTRSFRGFETCLVIGIGGSDLGARAAYQALAKTGRGMKLEFLGANTDPDEVYAVLKRIKLKKTIINIISKSGDTIEPMATFAIVRDRLQKAVGSNFAKHIVATTDIVDGSLHALSKAEGYVTLPVPKNIGGRFSVLTTVGLFPLACAGIDIEAMLKGAKSARNAFVQTLATRHDVGMFAMNQVMAYQKGRHINVLMPYSSRLASFAVWYRQIWAESLGKKGKGPTPIAALGATDQHSQLQLYMEGPHDKTVTFIEVDEFDHDMRVPSSAPLEGAVSVAKGKRLSDIIHAEREATAKALAHAGRMNGTLHIPCVDEMSVGALFMFFELATAISGHLLGINPYDQPGVEQGKTNMYAILKK